VSHTFARGMPVMRCTPGKIYLGVAYSLETVFEKLFVVWDAYELFVFIVFGLEKDLLL
jgi:hypothetical protein